MKKTILLSLLVLTQNSFAAEADNFTARLLDIPDISSDVNSLANNYLSKAVSDVNKGATGCDQKVLYTEMQKYFGNHSNGELVKDILYTDKVQKYVLPLKESVYEEWSPINGYLLGRKSAATSPLALSALITIGEQKIGVDKLEHMFGTGFRYFTQHHLEGKSIKKVLSGGVFLEKTILGGNVVATGVFAYGDLSANFNGMRFWNHVLQKQDDVLGSDHNIGPYVTCTNNKWSVNKSNPIDFKKYIDASMDESINCSKFASRAGLKKFQAAIERRKLVNTNGEAACPLDPSLLKEMKNKYKAHGINRFIINDKGNETVSYLNEIE